MWDLRNPGSNPVSWGKNYNSCNIDLFPDRLPNFIVLTKPGRLPNLLSS